MEMPGAPAPFENKGGGALAVSPTGCLKCGSDTCRQRLLTNLSRLAGCRIDLRVDLARRKARDASIAAHDRLALFERQHVFDVGKAVRRALLDRVDDALRSAAAVHLH